MTVTEAAKELGVTPRRVRALIEAGAIRAEQHGKIWWIPKLSEKVRHRKTGRPRTRR
jgi:excisionase family DNA binding protein